MDVAHYCTFDSFYKIVTSRCLRYSDVTMSNDSKEVFWALEEYLKKNVYPESFAGVFSDSLMMTQRHYALCFSYKTDNLEMWSYSDFNGVALVFDTDKIDKWTANIGLPDSSDIRNDNVEYVCDIDCEKCSNGINRIISYEDFIEHYKSDTDSDKIGFIDKKLIENRSYAFVKTARWAYEEEYRSCFVTCPPSGNCNINNTENNKYIGNIICLKDSEKEIPVCFDIKQNMRTYYEIPMDDTLVKEIILGPKCVYTREMVYDFYKSNFPKSDIKKEDVTYSSLSKYKNDHDDANKINEFFDSSDW